MTAADESNLVCLKCNRTLVYDIANLNYLGHRISEKFLRCPVCKQIYIPEDVVLGKMAEVEESLEDK